MLAKLVILSALVLSPLYANACMAAAMSPAIEQGRDIAFDKRKGNCLACHAIPQDPLAISPGNIGPPLKNLKSRYRDIRKLRAQIWDATALNPKTSMPPFGKNSILTEQEIDLLIEYIYSM
jgi:L-cysteine S-thiosulfotransferase